MEVRILTSAEDLQAYGSWVRSHSHGSLWQSLERRQYLQALGKEVRVYVIGDDAVQASAMVTIDRTALGLSTWDIPRGPLGDTQELLAKIIADAKADRCMALYLSPFTDAKIAGGKPSSRHIHCEATRVLDLTKTEEQILADMKPKGRYNIRVAEKNNVRVQKSDDIDAFFTLVQSTGNRDGFTTLSKTKYKAFLEHLPGSFLLLAIDTENSPIAGLIGVCWNGRGIYYYGASSYAHRALMAPYALQWAAIQHCKRQGCISYDLLGVAPPNTDKGHPWAGITRFKEQFGGMLEEYPAEQELILRPMSKMLLDWKRKIFR